MEPDRLKQIPLFAELSDEERGTIARLADEIEVPEGKVLAAEGEFAYEFFVVTEGRVEVTKDGEPVAELGPGDFFGEIGLLERELRTATVTAKTPLRVISMYGPHLRRVEREMPSLAERIRAAIRDRLLHI